MLLVSTQTPRFLGSHMHFLIVSCFGGKGAPCVQRGQFLPLKMSIKSVLRVTSRGISRMRKRSGSRSTGQDSGDCPERWSSNSAPQGNHMVASVTNSAAAQRPRPGDLGRSHVPRAHRQAQPESPSVPDGAHTSRPGMTPSTPRRACTPAVLTVPTGHVPVSPVRQWGHVSSTRLCPRNRAAPHYSL